MAFYICTFTVHHSNTTIIYCLSLSLWHILTCSDAHTLHCKLRSQKKLLFAGGVAGDLFVSVVVVQGRTKDSASTARFLWMSIQRERIMFCAISCTTNHILRKLKYFREENFMTIAGQHALIVGSGRATIITLPMGTQLTVEDALLYPDSTHMLLCYIGIYKIGFFMWKYMRIIKINFFPLLNFLDMPSKFVKNSSTLIWIVLYIH